MQEFIVLLDLRNTSFFPKGTDHNATYRKNVSVRIRHMQEVCFVIRAGSN